MAIGLSKWFKETFLGIIEEKTVRSRNKKGKYVGDDKSTPNVNEAYTTVNVRKDNLKQAQKEDLKDAGLNEARCFLRGNAVIDNFCFCGLSHDCGSRDRKIGNSVANSAQQSTGT